MFSFLNLVVVFLMHQHIPYNAVDSQLYDVEKYSSSKEFPWIVRIFHNGEHLCAGAIVSKELIITPNHCVAKYAISSLKVLVRYLNIPERMYEVLEVISHPNFSWSPSIQNDIAFLKIPSKLSDGEGVTSIRLPSNDFKDPDEAVFVSWGCKYKTECKLFVMVRKMLVKIVPTEECRLSYNDVPIANINSEKICAGKFLARRGESGGGLLAYNYTGNETPILIGILSFHSSLDSFNYKSPVFTNLSSHSDFINKYVHSSARIQHGQTLCNFVLIFYIFVNSL